MNNAPTETYEKMETKVKLTAQGEDLQKLAGEAKTNSKLIGWSEDPPNLLVKLRPTTNSQAEVKTDQSYWWSKDTCQIHKKTSLNKQTV